MRDLDNAAAVKVYATQLTTEHPSLNAAIHCAGIMRAELPKDGDLDDAEATIATNLLGPIRLNAKLLGHLMSQPRVTVATESSGLAFLPLPFISIASRCVINSRTLRSKCWNWCCPMFKPI